MNTVRFGIILSLGKKSSLWHISVNREKGICVVKAATMLTANGGWRFSEDGTCKLRSELQEENT